MKVKMTDKKGEIREVNASYGMRLIEQGKAVPVRASAAVAQKAEKPVKAEAKAEAKN